MKGLLPVIFLTHCIIVSAEENKTAKTNVTEIKIKELEKTREDLLKQINGAIHDSVVALEKANDSESAAGLQYLTKLKNELKVIDSKENGIEANNKTNLDAENMTNTFYSTDLAKKFRRMGKAAIFAKDGAIYHEFETLYKMKKGRTTISARQRKIEKDIQKWMDDRAKEKEKILQYRERLKRRDVGLEKCPNFGIEYKKRDEIGLKKKKKGERNKSRNYPCCRKCCKSSYLGCL